MTIVVNTHNQQEESALLAFLDQMKYEYVKGDIALSAEQQQEILDRDREFEAGKTESYSLDEIIAHFNIKE